MGLVQYDQLAGKSGTLGHGVVELVAQNLGGAHDEGCNRVLFPVAGEDPHRIRPKDIGELLELGIGERFEGARIPGTSARVQALPNRLHCNPGLARTGGRRHQHVGALQQSKRFTLKGVSLERGFLRNPDPGKDRLESGIHLCRRDFLCLGFRPATAGPGSFAPGSAPCVGSFLFGSGSALHGLDPRLSPLHLVPGAAFRLGRFQFFTSESILSSKESWPGGPGLLDENEKGMDCLKSSLAAVGLSQKTRTGIRYNRNCPSNLSFPARMSGKGIFSRLMRGGCSSHDCTPFPFGSVPGPIESACARVHGREYRWLRKALGTC